MGILAAVWAVASAIGPTIGMRRPIKHLVHILPFITGGVFAEKLSWRWLFCTSNHESLNGGSTLMLVCQISISLSPLSPSLWSISFSNSRHLAMISYTSYRALTGCKWCAFSSLAPKNLSALPVEI